MYSEEELEEKQKEWLKDASTDPVKKERIQIIRTLLEPIQYKDAATKEDIIQSYAASGLDMQFILNYAENCKKFQGVYRHFS